MLTVQSPAMIPRIHTIYTDLPAPSRRAANVPFLAARCVPAGKPPRAITIPHYAQPTPTRRAPPPPPRRNAVSYTPDENPFADSASSSFNPSPSSSSQPVYTPSRPRPSSFTKSPSTYASRAAPPPVAAATVSYTMPPATLTRAQRDMRSRAVACMLLNRGGARPMRRRIGAVPRSYVRSGLSECVALEQDMEDPEYDDA